MKIEQIEDGWAVRREPDELTHDAEEDRPYVVDTREDAELVARALEADIREDQARRRALAPRIKRSR